MIMRKDEFIAHGCYCTSNCGGYEIQINECGDGARYRLLCMDKIIRKGRWQEIKFTSTGRAYIKDNNTRLYLENFMRY